MHPLGNSLRPTRTPLHLNSRRHRRAPQQSIMVCPVYETLTYNLRDELGSGQATPPLVERKTNALDCSGSPNCGSEGTTSKSLSERKTRVLRFSSRAPPTGWNTRDASQTFRRIQRIIKAARKRRSPDSDQKRVGQASSRDIRIRPGTLRCNSQIEHMRFQLF